MDSTPKGFRFYGNLLLVYMTLTNMLPYLCLASLQCSSAISFGLIYIQTVIPILTIHSSTRSIKRKKFDDEIVESGISLPPLPPAKTARSKHSLYHLSELPLFTSPCLNMGICYLWDLLSSVVSPDVFDVICLKSSDGCCTPTKCCLTTLNNSSTIITHIICAHRSAERRLPAEQFGSERRQRAAAAEAGARHLSPQSSIARRSRRA